MKTTAALAIAASLALGACASSDQQLGLDGNRSVFHNPYAAPELANGPVGPDQCADCPGIDGRWLEGLTYPGRGDFAYDRNGNRVQLSRADRRVLRARFRAIRDQAEINRRVEEFNARQAAAPPIPAPTAPPVASKPASEN